MNQGSRMKFTELDDINLIRIVEQMAKPDWKKISTLMKKWTPRQCRDRYNNYLSPNVQNKKWTKEEEQMLLDKYSIYGPRWSFLTRFFHNRAAVNIKNHYTKLSFKNANNKRKENIYQGENDDSGSENPNSNKLNDHKKKEQTFILDLEDDDFQFELDHDCLDYPIEFFSNEIFSFIM